MTSLGRYLRLKNSIASAIEYAGESAFAAKALGDAYGKFRGEALAIAKETQTEDEFERLFPARPNESVSSVRSGFDPIHASTAAHEARILLGSLAGWLDGFVVEGELRPKD